MNTDSQHSLFVGGGLPAEPLSPRSETFGEQDSGVFGEQDAKPLVRVERATRVYRVGTQEVHALRGADLSVGQGQFVALRGRSGSGKTTLLNLIGGLDRPTSGEVYFDGLALTGMSERELTRLRRHRVGFVFQSFALLPTYSAFENVELLLRIAGVGMRERAQRARNSLRLVGLSRWVDHRPDEMSGGQQQRLAIARALVTRPDLILADEPTGELDTTTGRQIFALLRQVVQVEGITVLTATHDPLVDEYADRVHELQDGRIVKRNALRYG
jgi:putative ABC transport system ATP-binding protein